MTTHFQIEARKLVLSSRYQARKTPGQMPLAELADTIAAQGLLQNLVVTKGKKRGVFEVVAGGRRLRAIQMLLADGRWAQNQTVWVELVDNDHALEASITENVKREDMHPADEFDAFATLVGQGSCIEDVAARFGVAPNVVKRRLRLAGVAPELIQAYRDKQMSLDVLMAFTVCEDQDRQRDLWQGLDAWDRKDPGTIRRRLAAETITAAHALARFVGLEAYHEAGGKSFEDLFAQDDGQGTYLQDTKLLETLALDKLQAAAAPIREEGWAWVDVQPTTDRLWDNFGRVRAQQGKLTKAQAAQVKALTKKIDAISVRMDALAQEDDDDEWLRLEEEHDSLSEEREAISNNAQIWPATAKELGGVGICIGSDGAVRVERGLIDPKDRKQFIKANETAIANGEDGIASSLPAPVTRPTHSERLVRQLTANKVGIVAADLAGKPDIALAVMVAQLARNVLGWGYFAYGNYGLGISVKQEAISQHAPDFEASKAGIELAKYRQHWLDTLPLDEDGQLSEAILDWALTQDTASLLDLLAYLLAVSVQGVQHQESDSPTALDRLATITGVDIAQWWEPTADSYLAHVSKDQISGAVAQALGPDQAQPIAKQKKIEAAASAEQLLAGKGWLPTILQVKVETVAS